MRSLMSKMTGQTGFLIHVRPSHGTLGTGYALSESKGTPEGCRSADSLPLNTTLCRQQIDRPGSMEEHNYGKKLPCSS